MKFSTEGFSILETKMDCQGFNLIEHVLKQIVKFLNTNASKCPKSLVRLTAKPWWLKEGNFSNQKSDRKHHRNAMEKGKHSQLNPDRHNPCRNLPTKDLLSHRTLEHNLEPCGRCQQNQSLKDGDLFVERQPNRTLRSS